MDKIIIQRNNNPVVSHITISEKTGNESRSIRILIDNHIESIETLGVISFEMTKPIGNKGGRPTKEYFLNEDQATFLMTLLKNTHEVVDFKLTLVTEFKRLREIVEKPLSFEEVMKNALLLADQRVKKLEEKVLLDKPKVEFAEAISKTDESMLIRDFCKLINGKGIDIGQNRLFKWMRDSGYLMNDNKPYQQFSKYFDVSERKVSSITGSKLVFTTHINGKGQEYFYNKLRIYQM